MLTAFRRLGERRRMSVDEETVTTATGFAFRGSGGPRWLQTHWISYDMLTSTGGLGEPVPAFQTYPVIFSFFFLLRRRERFHQSCRHHPSASGKASRSYLLFFRGLGLLTEETGHGQTPCMDVQNTRPSGREDGREGAFRTMDAHGKRQRNTQGHGGKAARRKASRCWKDAGSYSFSR